MIATTPHTTRRMSTALQRAGAGLLIAGALFGAGASQAATVSAETFATGVVSQAIVDQVFFGSFNNPNWHAVQATTSAPRRFVLGTGEADNGTYAFLYSRDSFVLSSVTVVFNGGQSDSQDGWLEFYNGNSATPVATGNDKAKDGTYVGSMSFNIGGTQSSLPRSFTMTANPALTGLTYNRVLLVYGRESAAAQSVAVSTLQVQGQTAPVPEPSTYAMMLAGIGAIGFMTRRRKQSHD
ncbi:PEP-CTERM sorting domain-containing protein [Sphaerotilus mobilis]|uniref:Putative secreted protein with PEP-CTERM sorting signal n=1 Tax=Sphaerotilus mobilis TaxID=47994 RepID=A0A4Q7LCI2_9BURK|nr:PEP-CTERM sorting domain-containing protein [Sphaerotilus mobilis]RZS52095.1 putative secreted protein with PEP-CTERM sorting signal [Sphaerotilus mobilis]